MVWLLGNDLIKLIQIESDWENFGSLKFIDMENNWVKGHYEDINWIDEVRWKKESKRLIKELRDDLGC